MPWNYNKHYSVACRLMYEELYDQCMLPSVASSPSSRSLILLLLLPHILANSKHHEGALVPRGWHNEANAHIGEHIALKINEDGGCVVRLQMFPLSQFFLPLPAHIVQQFQSVAWAQRHTWNQTRWRGTLTVQRWRGKEHLQPMLLASSSERLRNVRLCDLQRLACESTARMKPPASSDAS